MRGRALTPPVWPARRGTTSVKWGLASSRVPVRLVWVLGCVGGPASSFWPHLTDAVAQAPGHTGGRGHEGNVCACAPKAEGRRLSVDVSKRWIALRLARARRSAEALSAGLPCAPKR